MGLFDRFRRSKRRGAITLSDDEKGAAFEQDPTRLHKERTSRGRRRSSAGSGEVGTRERYIGNWAPHPGLIRTVRFFLYLLTSLSALTTAALCLSVVVYYNTHGPVIKPSWGSLIACVVFGILTPGWLFLPMFITPRLIRRGSALDIVNQTRMELAAVFGLAVIWVSGALALACDLRGRENCIWDGYWHYPKPSDFGEVCDRINWSVALAYTTFGLSCLQMVVVWAFAGYILLYLDQEVLTEHTNAMGTRAYLARSRALQQQRVRRAAAREGISIAPRRRLSGTSSFGEAVGARLRPEDEETGGPMMAERRGSEPFASRTVPPSSPSTAGGPMMGGTAPHAPVASRGVPPGLGPVAGPSAGEGVRSSKQPATTASANPFDDERGGYYGFETEDALSMSTDRALRSV
ncbi:hypothetical protein JCM8097_009045 [Rhodosporidiobolus ruineniae]